MDSFYRNLKTVPIKSEALQFAQRSLLSGEYHWADNQLVTPHGAVEFPELDPQQVGKIDLSHPYIDKLISVLLDKIEINIIYVLSVIIFFN